VAQTRECCKADRYVKDSEGRSNNTEHLKRSKDKQNGTKKKKRGSR
jgi:hypothetical protein